MMEEQHCTGANLTPPHYKVAPMIPHTPTAASWPGKRCKPPQWGLAANDYCVF